MHPRLGVLLVASTAIAACAVGPDYKPPEMPTPPGYSADVAPSEVAAAPTELGMWWRQFHDPELSVLVEQGLRDNLDLKTAVSRIREARQQAIMAGAAGLPALNADANATRLHISQNSGISEFTSLLGGNAGGPAAASGGITPPGTNITTYTVGFDASWELDVFGGVRRSVEAARAQTEQAVWSSRDSEVTIAAEVASDYLTVRALQRQISVLQDEVARQEQTLSLVSARHQFGFVTELDVRQQRAQLASAKSSLPGLHAQMMAQIHALGVLLGDQPEALEAELTVPQALPPQPPSVPAGLPSDLLRRRPDIRAAERSLAASNAQIGVAIADLYPKFNLTGAFDFVSIDLKHLLEGSSRQYNGTGAISWPLFAGGKIRANTRAAKEENLQALYSYQKTVLGALQDVEDALTRYADEQKSNLALRDTLTEAQGTAEVALAQYRAGLIDFSPVLSAHGTVLNTQSQLAQSDGMLARDLVSLYKALGGGWLGSEPAVMAAH